MASIEESRVRTSAVACKQRLLLLSLLLLPAAGRLDFMPPIWAATVHSALTATAPLTNYLQRSLAPKAPAESDLTLSAGTVAAARWPVFVDVVAAVADVVAAVVAVAVARHLNLSETD